ncbi:uncharacterized protein [Choristoneura fumiferana]|uniref:uncharacterized protein n=1 Tax=Choristoneura fumiferana TaxID=7141 RepID=UPI003D1595F5
MTFYCAVPGCSSNSKTTNYTFHRLPRNVIARARWILALGRRAGTLDRCALVCRRHFEECMLRRGGRAVGLIKNAVPTLFMPPKRPIQPALSSEDTDNEEGLLDSEPENQSEDEVRLVLFNIINTKICGIEGEDKQNYYSKAQAIESYAKTAAARDMHLASQSYSDWCAGAARRAPRAG